MREKLLFEGADADCVARGLAGLDSPKAREMREKLLSGGADKDWSSLGAKGDRLNDINRRIKLERELGIRE